MRPLSPGRIAEILLKPDADLLIHLIENPWKLSYMQVLQEHVKRHSKREFTPETLREGFLLARNAAALNPTNTMITFKRRMRFQGFSYQAGESIWFRGHLDLPEDAFNSGAKIKIRERYA